MIQVFYAPPSIYDRKVLAVLEEKGLDYEIKRMSFETQDSLKDDYLKLNPNGEIPTLVDDSFVVYESTAILEYLNDEYPEPPLLPEDSAGRARARMVEDYCDLHFYKAVIRVMIKKTVKHEEPTEEESHKLAEAVKRIEAYLGKQEFIAGPFTLADCAVMPAVATLEAMGLWESFKPSKALQDYVKRLKARPGYKGANLLTLEAVSSQA